MVSGRGVDADADWTTLSRDELAACVLNLVKSNQGKLKKETFDESREAESQL